MEMVSESNKWVYKGSMTTPPCRGPYFVQVFDRILPVDPEIVGHIRKMQKRSNRKNLGATGNYRDTQLYNEKQEATYVVAIEDRDTVIIDKVVELIILGVIMCAIMCCASAFWYKICPEFNEAVENAPDLFDQGSEEEDEDEKAEA